jgi:hypothetical protein
MMELRVMILRMKREEEPLLKEVLSLLTILVIRKY